MTPTKIYQECLLVERSGRLAREASNWKGYLKRLDLLLAGMPHYATSLESTLSGERTP